MTAEELQLIHCLKHTTVSDLFPLEFGHSTELAQFDEEDANRFIDSRGTASFTASFHLEYSIVRITISSENGLFGFRRNMSHFKPFVMRHRTHNINEGFLTVD